jgi:hypothetical protein
MYVQVPRGSMETANKASAPQELAPPVSEKATEQSAAEQSKEGQRTPVFARAEEQRLVWGPGAGAEGGRGALSCLKGQGSQADLSLPSGCRGDSN